MFIKLRFSLIWSIYPQKFTALSTFCVNMYICLVCLGQIINFHDFLFHMELFTHKQNSFTLTTQDMDSASMRINIYFPLTYPLLSSSDTSFANDVSERGYVLLLITFLDVGGLRLYEHWLVAKDLTEDQYTYHASWDHLR